MHRQKGHRQKGFQTKGPKNTDKRATDKKAKKADKRAKIKVKISPHISIVTEMAV